jgi:exopolysaccharide biosynthesis polyprenyl glycosylphosphotransferase
MTSPTPPSATLANDAAPWAATAPGVPELDARVGRLVPRRVIAAARHPETVPMLLLAADAASVAFALGIGVQFLAGAQLRPAAIAAPAIGVVLGKISGLYARPGRGLGQSTLAEVPRLAQLATLLALLGSLAGHWLVFGPWQVQTTAVLWASLLVALPLGRGLARRLPAAVAPERCLVIGSPQRSARVRRTIHGLSGGRTLVVGWITSDQVVAGDGNGALLREAVGYFQAEHVVVAPDVADSGETLALIRALEEFDDVRVTVLPRLLELASATLTAEVLGAASALDVRRLALSRSERVVKRTMDIAGASVLLLLMAPAAVAIALAIRFTSSGPVLFRQQRIGRDGRQFTMWKFRTMVSDAEAHKRELEPLNEAQGLFKISQDPRVTRVGRVVRRTALDELPQLVNVVRGEMSLVGPRPLVPDEDTAIAGWHRRRLQMRPGMTGVWQVMGSARVPMSEMVELDNLYVLSWSPWLDVKILLRTLDFVIGRRGL